MKTVSIRQAYPHTITFLCSVLASSLIGALVLHSIEFEAGRSSWLPTYSESVLPAVGEQEFATRYAAVVQIPESIVTPERTFTRYYLDSSYYFFVDGQLVLKSPDALPKLRRG